jgi:hypothetical protein
MVSGGVTKAISFTRLIRQRYALSPLLFSMVTLKVGDMSRNSGSCFIFRETTNSSSIDK